MKDMSPWLGPGAAFTFNDEETIYFVIRAKRQTHNSKTYDVQTFPRFFKTVPNLILRPNDVGHVVGKKP